MDILESSEEDIPLSLGAELLKDTAGKAPRLQERFKVASSEVLDRLEGNVGGNWR